ncbi:putative pituitary adenylate cyclase-activating polypeptide type I receptor-like [Scophthalmus maximus]|uniref:Putative pituitary adenylate cyclase-activating polypeptide type I receptor-like n=1 Tax=Scophthalmus maximus TaxID=52904 RepID=A0A2U9C337_SCOMX|nr:putative pituitary adenylate cyclase-activating polypeptide type I receptor-like [Scophthalmus maximus]
MAQLDGEPVLCCGPEAPAPLAGEQRRERGHAVVHPQQEQLADPHVQPAGRGPGHLSAAAAPPALVPMTSLADPFLNPYPNPYPDEATVETQLDSRDPDHQPLV